MQNRLTNFSKILKDKKLDNFITTNPINIFYLCGFRGISQTERESFLVFNPRPTLIAPRLYQKEARSLESRDLSIYIAPERDEMWTKTLKLVLHPKGVAIGFEKDNLTYGEYQELDSRLRGNDKLTLVPTENLIENMRMIKTADETAKIEKAQLISQKAFYQLIKTIKVGQTEEEIADKLSNIIKSLGGQGLAFESIIASGPNAGTPHHISSSRKIKSGEVLLLDFGATFENYHGDLSRTVFIGSAKDEHKKVFHHVLKAQQKAIKQIKKDTRTHEAFHFANDHFVNLNVEKFFLHSLGHGIGLEIHEEPYLRRSSIDNSLLTDGMVFSVEPGLYFPWGGVRIEDLVVIKNGKAKVLGKIQEEIIEI